MTGRAIASERLPRSGNVALASGALIQLALGVEFVLAGLSKVVDPDFPLQFRTFVTASPGAVDGPLSGLIQLFVAPNTGFIALLAMWTELLAGTALVVTAVEVLRRRLASPIGAEHRYEPLMALVSTVAAFALGCMSLAIYMLEGGRFPRVDAGFAFTSPIAIELFVVPLALAIALLEFGRYWALRHT